MTRRGFFATVAAALVLRPLAQLAPPIRGGAITWKICRDFPVNVVIQQRKLMARVRITPEAMADSVQGGAWAVAQNDELRRLTEDFRGVFVYGP